MSITSLIYSKDNCFIPLNDGTYRVPARNTANGIILFFNILTFPLESSDFSPMVVSPASTNFRIVTSASAPMLRDPISVSFLIASAGF